MNMNKDFTLGSINWSPDYKSNHSCKPLLDYPVSPPFQVYLELGCGERHEIFLVDDVPFADLPVIKKQSLISRVTDHLNYLLMADKVSLAVLLDSILLKSAETVKNLEFCEQCGDYTTKMTWHF